MTSVLARFARSAGALGLMTGAVAACQPAKPAPMASPHPTGTVDLSPRPRLGAAPSSAAMKPTSSPTPPADDLAAETSGPIPEGLATWRGTAVPTKGGVSVRGVVLDRAAFAKLLSANAADGVPGEPDWYLGAVVRVRGVVERHVDEPSPEEAALHAQRRAGAWLSATRLESVELVQAAQVVEGELLQSKGFFQVGQALVTPRDIRWALGSAHVGDRVRLWGQLHVQVCDPRAQCLLGGSLPIFEVGRAKKID